MPQRVKLRRINGWRTSSDVISVSANTRWRNPFEVRGRRVVRDGVEQWPGLARTPHDAALLAVAAFRWQTLHRPDKMGFTLADIRTELAGHDLGCTCRLGHPCHGDVLLELAAGADEPLPDRARVAALLRAHQVANERIGRR